MQISSALLSPSGLQKCGNLQKVQQNTAKFSRRLGEQASTCCTARMDADEALRFIEILFSEQKKRLNDLQRAVFRGSWQGKSYKEIRQDYPICTLEHLMRNVGPKLWKLISEVLDQPVSKANLRGPIEQAWIARSMVADSFSSARLPNADSTLNTSTPSASMPFPGQMIEGVDRFDTSGRDTFYEAILYEATLPEIPLPEIPLPDANSATSPLYGINVRLPDWGTAPDVTLFCGRTRELAQLEQWTVIDGCRLITLYGMGGIGKTDLAVKLAQRVRNQFEFLIWRSLKNWQFGDRPPGLADLLADLTQSFARQQAHEADHQSLLHYLTHHRCLLILDSWETVLAGGVHDGSYAAGYEAYAEFVRQLGATDHQSCVILTSREKPKEVALIEGENHPVRSWELAGLGAWEGRKIFLAKNASTALETDWNILIHRYGGNPFALNAAATLVLNLFDGNISDFLAQLTGEATLLSDICYLLEQQLERLSDLERQVVQYLTASREPVTITHILSTLDSTVSWAQLQEVLQSLKRRSLIRINAMHYSLQPLLMEYLSVRESQC